MFEKITGLIALVKDAMCLLYWVCMWLLRLSSKKKLEIIQHHQFLAARGRKLGSSFEQ